MCTTAGQIHQGEKNLPWWSKSRGRLPNRKALWLHFPPQQHPSSQRVRGRPIHQNSLCSARYTKEPLRISDGPLCLWLSTLRAIPSSPSTAWCELINHSNELSRREQGRPATAHSNSHSHQHPHWSHAEQVSQLLYPVSTTTKHRNFYVERNFCTFLNVAVLLELLGILKYTQPCYNP